MFPPGRYGRRRAVRGRVRRLSVLVSVAGALLGLVLAGVLYARYGAPAYRPTVVGYELADDHATVRLRVHKPAGRAAVCHVRAVARSGAEVGAADVPVPVGADVTVTHTFPTGGRATVVTVSACGTPG